MPYVSFDSFFGTLQHMGPALGAPKIGKCNFWEIQNGWLRPHSSLKKKVQKTKLSQNFWFPVNPLWALAINPFFKEFGPLMLTLGKDGLSMHILPPSGDVLVILGFKPLECAKERVCTNFHLDWLLWRMSRKGGGRIGPPTPPLSLIYAASGRSQ